MKKITAIVGPTGSGKSNLANILASQVNGEVVSADSMQIYTGMDVGTGKIMPDEMLVKHWMLDVVDPGHSFSVAEYQQLSREAFETISKAGKVPILCGGTGFYIRGAIDDYDYSVPDEDYAAIKNATRNKYQDILNNEGKEKLMDLLKEKDPDSASVIHVNNTVRVIRALELADEGKSYYDNLNNLKNVKQLYNADIYGLRVDRQVLYKMINSRVDKMIQDGLVDEVKGLLDQGFVNAVTSKNAIGYKEIVDYLNGKCALSEAIEQIKQSTRRYAKRQMTWFNKDKRIHWIEYTNQDVKGAVNIIKKLSFKVV